MIVKEIKCLTWVFYRKAEHFFFNVNVIEILFCAQKGVKVSTAKFLIEVFILEKGISDLKRKRNQGNIIQGQLNAKGYIRKIK